MMLDVKSFQLQSFLPLPYEEVLAPRLKRAHEKLQSGSGAGGEFTGWVHLPRDYDKEEFSRIQAASAISCPSIGIPSRTTRRTDFIRLTSNSG